MNIWEVNFLYKVGIQTMSKDWSGNIRIITDITIKIQREDIFCKVLNKGFVIVWIQKYLKISVGDDFL